MAKACLPTMFILKIENRLVLAGVVCAFLFFNPVATKAVTTITFTLDEPCKTSAGVYKSDGSLVRTLWSNVRYYAAGTYRATWDGQDDNGNLVAAGTYTVKVLQHNVQYVWNGVIGNTSLAQTGFSVHHGFRPMHDMSMVSTNAFYCSGYNEAYYGFRFFYTNNPQAVVTNWFWDTCINSNTNIQNTPGIATRNWWYASADSINIYYACDSTYKPSTADVYGGSGCVVASKVGDQSLVIFSGGTTITNGLDQFPSGFYAGTQPGLSGLAVQPNGNILAVSVYPDNKVYLFNKTTGVANNPGSFPVTAPGRLYFATNGNLFVTTTNSVLCYTNLNGTPALCKTYSGFVSPLAVAISPMDTNLILVADGGSSQQVKALNFAGTMLWTNGLAGGYQTNGPAVQNNKFWFVYLGERNGGATITNTLLVGTFISFAPDGTYWIGDEGNSRTLHFSITKYLEQIMWQPALYVNSVDQNNPSRVFSGFQEFSVDYTKPLSNSWTLVKNWEPSADLNHANAKSREGVYDVTTLTNGHTYCLVQNTAYYPYPAFEVCELVPGVGLRYTGVFPGGTNVNNWVSLSQSGDAYYVIPNYATFYKYPLTGFDGGNNPQYGSIQTVASAPNGSTSPVPRCCSGGGPLETFGLSTNGIVLSFDSTLNNGFHLGGIKYGAINWLWQSLPSGSLNNDGHFEITGGLTYPAQGILTLDNQVICGYHGEYFRSQGQAAQYFHYLDDGLFVGQFGECGIIGTTTVGASGGFAGNNVCPVFVKTNGNYYVYGNDESAHGLQRWQLVNAVDMFEASGSGALNGTINLTNPFTAFPTGVNGIAGDGTAQVYWRSVSRATGYKIYYSNINGGPYLTSAGSTTATNYFVSGLSNGQTYYFVVKAVVGGSEGPDSKQVSIQPFDISKQAIAVGRLDDNWSSILPIYINTNNPSSGLPAVTGIYRYVCSRDYLEVENYGKGQLVNPQIGSEGYVLYGFNGSGSDVANLLDGINTSTPSGFTYVSGNSRYYVLNNTVSNYSTAYELTAATTGSIGISVADTNYHCLTVMTPAQGVGKARNFTLSLVSTNGDTAAYDINDPYGNHQTLQFYFKGDVSLCVTNYNSTTVAGVQSLFFDKAARIQNPNGSLPPTGIEIQALTP